MRKNLIIKKLPVQIGVLALFFSVYHLFLYYSMREMSINLGAVRLKGTF